MLVWPVPLAQVWSGYNVGWVDTTYDIILQSITYISFLKNQIWKESIYLNWILDIQNVTMFSTDFSFQNLVFKILFEFSAAEFT